VGGPGQCGRAGFVARRLAGSRVGFLAAYRSGEESFFERSGLPGYELEPLDDDAAAALIGDRFPALAPRVRQRLLADAQGNPLALLELPVALLSGPQRAGALPVVLPLGRRLQSLFASRVSGLPAATRDLLLLAALDGTGDLGVLRGAVSGQRGIEDLGPAERARLVQVDLGNGRLVFRHPLTRSAVVELSTSDQRRRVHAVLVELADRPERRALAPRRSGRRARPGGRQPARAGRRRDLAARRRRRRPCRAAPRR
jgi:hypothetical protein